MAAAPFVDDNRDLGRISRAIIDAPSPAAADGTGIKYPHAVVIDMERVRDGVEVVINFYRPGILAGFDHVAILLGPAR